MVQVTSSNIKEVDYINGTLVVVFHNGSAYAYADVDPETVCAVVFAKSVGKAFNAQIIPNYEAKKIL